MKHIPKVKLFLNLTNGIEALQRDNINIDNIHFIRIQSTAIEQKRFDFIIKDLDNDFLMWLALGYHCIVYDYGASKTIPKAMYYGLSWINYVLNRYWFKRITKPYIKNYNSSQYFDEQYQKIEKCTFKRLRYFKNFLMTNEIYLNYDSDLTKKDSNIEYYKNILKNA